MTWTVDFHEDVDGDAPVEAFLEGLPKQQRVKALALVKLLEEQETTLLFPYSSQVRGRLRELRTRFGKTRLRILYFADSRRIFILLHGVVKTTEKLPESDIRKAEERIAVHDQRLERGR